MTVFMSAARRFRQFSDLTPADRRLLVATGSVVFGVRLMLWLLPARRIAAMTFGQKGVETDTAGATSASAQRLAWAVRTTSRRIPGASCLTQALSLQLLLRRHGVASSLKIGVARAERGEGYVAHAWVEAGPRVLIGAGELERYAFLSDFSDSQDSRTQ